MMPNCNTINYDTKTKQILKLKSQLKNTDPILKAQVIENVRISNALIKVNSRGKFLPSGLKANMTNTISKTIALNKLELES